MRLTLIPFLIPLLTGAAPVDIGLASLQQEDLRIATIAYRLQRKNTALCRSLSPLPGFTVHDLNQYSPDVREEAKRVFGLGNQLAILAVVPNTPASRAGLMANDIVTAINGADTTAKPSKKATMTSVALANAAITSAAERLQIDLTRAGKPPISIRPESGCASRIEVVPGKALNASADGQVLQITTALIAFAGNDDAIATVIAHELAHNILAHRARLKLKGRSPGNIRTTELEADYWSMYLLMRGGYDLDRALLFWEHYEDKTNKGIFADGTHPGKETRLNLVRAAVEEIRAKQKAGQRLVPNEALPTTPR